MLKALFILVLMLPLGACSQLSFRTGIALHSDYFPDLYRDVKDPYGQFLQYSVGSTYQHKEFRYGLDISWLHDARHLEGRFGTHQYGSHGGPGYTYGDNREADAAFSYLGVRIGVDLELLRKRRFDLFLHLSQHLDFLVEEDYTNMYQTTYVYYDGDPPSVPPQFYTPPGYVQDPETHSADFPVLDLDELYCYTSIGLKPAFRFENWSAELDVLVNFFTTPRVINEMKNQYRGYEQYNVVVVGDILGFSNEIGLHLTYTLGRRSK